MDVLRDRMFRPAMVCSLGPYFLAVDELQPVAIAVSPNGEVVGKCSWEDLIPPPLETGWPRRRLESIPGGMTCWIADHPFETAVELTINESGRLRVEQAAKTSIRTSGSLTSYSKYAITRREVLTDSETWKFRSTLERFKWNARVDIATHGEPRSMDLGPGAVVAYAVRSGGIAAVGVRRADKRPWTFEPEYDLHIIDASGGGGGEKSQRTIEALAIGSHCWPRKSDRQLEKVESYLNYTFAEFRSLMRVGAKNVQLEVGNLESQPIIEMKFTLDSRPGVTFKRTDLPIDEIGNEGGGLRDLGVLLDEDLRGGVDQIGEDENGVVDI